MLDAVEQETKKSEARRTPSRAEYFREWRAKEKAKKERSPKDSAAEPAVAAVAGPEEPVALHPAMPPQHVEFQAQHQEPDPRLVADLQQGDKPDISRPPKRLPVRRETEFDAAFKRYEGLGQYAIEAEKNGTTIQAAMASYAALEGLCRSDPCWAKNSAGT